MMEAVLAGNFVADAINGWVSGALEWLWAWIQCLAYWVAALGGSTYLILFLVTHEKKFKTGLAVVVIGYILIKAAGSVI